MHLTWNARTDQQNGSFVRSGTATRARKARPTEEPGKIDEGDEGMRKIERVLLLLLCADKKPPTRALMTMTCPARGGEMAATMTSHRVVANNKTTEQTTTAPLNLRAAETPSAAVTVAAVMGPVTSQILTTTAVRVDEEALTTKTAALWDNAAMTSPHAVTTETEKETAMTIPTAARHVSDEKQFTPAIRMLAALIAALNAAPIDDCDTVTMTTMTTTIAMQ